MIADREHLVLEYLCALRATQADPGERLERLAQIEWQMHAIGRRLGALTKAVYGEKMPLPTPAGQP